MFDLCAAPGGKTAALVNLGGDVFAVDKSKRRLQILDSNLERLNLHAELIEGDILKLKPEFKADIILLDAPCSATGTLRRHPELVWQRKQEDVAELAELQKKLLNKVSHWLKPNGKILYCTCSLQKEEGELQIEKFLENHQDFKLLPMQNIPKEFISEQGYLRTTPAMLAEQGGIDGFFAALLQKI
ncbi:MAG: RsmB/NOP family class I SAM-dependent RNA methyltransferase [Pseudomonadota bacterium]